MRQKMPGNSSLLRCWSDFSMSLTVSVHGRFETRAIIVLYWTVRQSRRMHCWINTSNCRVDLHAPSDRLHTHHAHNNVQPNCRTDWKTEVIDFVRFIAKIMYFYLPNFMLIGADKIELKKADRKLGRF